MRPAEIVSSLVSFDGRGPGTDAERRAARWLADELAGAGREIRLEPFWCRPNWALAHLWHVALAVAGSLVALASPQLGIALLAIALISVLGDSLFGRSLGRRLTPERASQNVVARPAPTPDLVPAPGLDGDVGPEGRSPGTHAGIRLILSANYDCGRTGIAYRDVLRLAVSRLRLATAAVGPGWLGWLTIAIAWLLVVAILRLEDRHTTILGAVQLPATVALVIAGALLLDVALSDWSPGAGDNASGVAVAIALSRALDAAPPRHVSVELVLTGAGEGSGLGLRRHLAAAKEELRAANTIVIGFAPCGIGEPRWWTSDGRLIPLRYSSELRRLCAGVANDDPHFAARAYRGRGETPAFAARRRRLPAIALGCLDSHGLVPQSRLSTDAATTVDPERLDTVLQFGVMLVDAIDAFAGTSSEPESRLREKRRSSLRFSRSFGDGDQTERRDRS